MGRKSYLGGSTLVHVSNAKSNRRGALNTTASAASAEEVRIRLLNERVLVHLKARRSVPPDLLQDWISAVRTISAINPPSRITQYRRRDVLDVLEVCGRQQGLEKINSLSSNLEFQMVLLIGHSITAKIESIVGVLPVTETQPVYFGTASAIEKQMDEAGWVNRSEVERLFNGG